MISRKVIAVIFLAVGFGIGTLYWAFPAAFTAWVIDPLVAFGTGTVAFILAAPWQFVAGLGIMAFVTLGAKRIFNWIGRKWLGSKTIQPVYQTQPTYSPTLIQSTPKSSASTPAIAPSTPVTTALENKKEETAV